MLPKFAALSQPAFSLDRRGADRRGFTLSFDASEGPGTTAVVLLDLSRTGMRLRSSARLEIGEELDVVIPEAGKITARIVRKLTEGFEHEYGAEFHEPITEGAISAALLASPPLPRQASEGDIESHEGKFSRRTRLAILVGLTVGSWLVMGALGYAIARLF